MKVAPWKKVQDRYETTANGVKVTLLKQRKGWAVTIGDKSYDLKIKKPSFGHAEGIIKEHFKKRASDAMNDKAIAERVAARAAEDFPDFDEDLTKSNWGAATKAIGRVNHWASKIEQSVKQKHRIRVLRRSAALLRKVGEVVKAMDLPDGSTHARALNQMASKIDGGAY